ncbi:MAG: PepSY domain-containing protein [Pseudomonadota bacterium]
MASLSRTTLQHRVWRWHFIAGLMSVPFAVILAVTGATYLFKAQYENAVERAVNAAAPPAAAGYVLTADEIVAAAQSQYPDATFKRLFLPRFEGDRSMEVELARPDGARILWVDLGSGANLKDVAKDARLMNFVKRIHGTLMAGDAGAIVVELMASWMIVLIVTGAALWWPRSGPKTQAFAPKLEPKAAPPRETLRRLHGAGGAWIGGFVLLLLVSGLPWTQVWGDGFDRVQAAMGWESPGQEWFVTLQSSKPPKTDGLNAWSRRAGDEGAVTLTSSDPASGAELISLQSVLDKVSPQNLPAPTEIQPPRGANGVWTVRSMVQDRPKRQTIHYDRWTGEEVMRIRFSDYHPVKRAASYGIALHEGALFGPLNQAMGVAAALGVIGLSVTGGLMWWKRRPAGGLGAPPLPADRRLAAFVLATIGLLAAFLPLVALSLIAALACEALWSMVRRPKIWASGPAE